MNKLTEEEIEEIVEICVGVYDVYNVPRLYFELKEEIIKVGFLQSDWISVKEKLPDKYDRVLVTDGKKVCIHYKQSGVNWEDERGHDLYCSCQLNHDRCDFAEGSITHWMPLPKPPEE